MPKLAPVSRRILIKKLRKAGFVGPYVGGKHSFMVRGTLKLRIPNPHQRDVGVSLLKEILRQADITLDEWMHL